MQPVALSADIDASLIGMHEVGLRQLGLRPLLEALQPIIGVLIEIEDRTHTDRNVQLIPEVISYPIIGNQLVLRHIDRVGLQIGPY